MKLNDYEEALLAGKFGEPRRQAMARIVEIGRFFDAADCVEVAQSHIMADTEALGEAGVEHLEELAKFPEADRRVKIPTITDPRGADLNAYERINHDTYYVDLERRAIAAFRALGVMMTDTCINYQTVLPPVLGEHLAMGDTGVVIYSNSVQGARTNYEGGPAALAAALTGRTARYGFHLDEKRRGTARFILDETPKSWSEWGALGGIVGNAMGSYFQVPVIEGVTGTKPTSDDLKHFGAALASYGSTAMFHMVGVTPEAPDLATVFDGPPPEPRKVSRADLQAFMKSYGGGDDSLDIVVFAAPQLSVIELEKLAMLMKGRKVHDKVSLLVATNPENKHASDRFGFTETIENAGGIVLEGVCFYQMHARELGEANGWTRLMTNSAKLTNIIGGYGYQPVLADMEQCVDSAVAGRVVR
jgi:predicted aconitase